MTSKLPWSAWMAAVLMGVASWFGYWAQPSVRMADLHPRAPLADVLPARFGGWVQDPAGQTVPLPPDVEAQIKHIYTETADRVYRNAAGERMMVTLAYGKDQSDGFKVHRPEVCYAAQGFTVSPPVASTLDVGGRHIEVQHVDTVKGDRFEPVTYWMVIGDKVVNTPGRHKLRQIEYAFHGLIADGLLVRVSSFSQDARQAYLDQADFVRQWMAQVPADQRARLFGK
ncbi:MAG: exosortase-associated protein EpsI, B-type [Acidobacteriota bacterium]